MNNDLHPSSPLGARIAMAKAHGFIVRFNPQKQLHELLTPDGKWEHPYDADGEEWHCWSYAPDYPNDRQAIMECILHREDRWEEFVDEFTKLLKAVRPESISKREIWQLVTADNATLIEALLRAVGSWPEEAPNVIPPSSQPVPFNQATNRFYREIEWKPEEEITHTCEYHDGVTFPDGESCPQCDAEFEAGKKEHLPGYLAAKKQSPAALLIAQGGKIVLNEKIDELKSGQWWLWDCDVEMPDGRVIEGTVQGNEHQIEASTLEVDV